MNDTPPKIRQGKLTLFTGIGNIGDLVSNGFNPRNRLNIGVSLKSLVGTKNLLDAILEGGGTHAVVG